MLVFLLIVALAIFAPLVTNGQPYSGSALDRLKPIGTPGALLGTDELGRDMWTRLVYGGRLSLVAGAAPVMIALLLGGGLGVVAGYAGGRVNSAIMRTMDVFYAFPQCSWPSPSARVMGTGLASTIIALSIVFIPSLVRITETAATRVRSMDYIDAARASGVSDLQIIRHQVLPNILGPVLVYTASLASLSIILAAGLSFLGLGMPPPNADWARCSTPCARRSMSSRGWPPCPAS